MSRKLKEYVIYDSYDTYSEENMEEEKKRLLEDGMAEEDITDSMLMDSLCDSDRIWIEDEEDTLCRLDEGCGLIAIADLGRWNGRFSGYKEIKQLGTVLYTSCDYEYVYVDSNGDLRKEETHHDGSNSILYRYWKDGLTDEQKDNFMDKIYNGECTQRDITRYTRKAGIAIANCYGWTVRGGENKYRKVA